MSNSMNGLENSLNSDSMSELSDEIKEKIYEVTSGVMYFGLLKYYALNNTFNTNLSVGTKIGIVQKKDKKYEIIENLEIESADNLVNIMFIYEKLQDFYVEDMNQVIWYITEEGYVEDMIYNEELDHKECILADYIKYFYDICIQIMKYKKHRKHEKDDLKYSSETNTKSILDYVKKIMQIINDWYQEIKIYIPYMLNHVKENTLTQLNNFGIMGAFTYKLWSDKWCLCLCGEYENKVNLSLLAAVYGIDNISLYPSREVDTYNIVFSEDIISRWNKQCAKTYTLEERISKLEQHVVKLNEKFDKMLKVLQTI